MKKLPKIISLLLLFITINSSLSYASSNTIVNTNMNISEIIEVAKKNKIILNVSSMKNLTINQKQEIVETINTMYIDSFNSNNKKSLPSKLITPNDKIIMPTAVDGSIQKRNLTAIYNGTEDIQGSSRKYQLKIIMPCDIYSDTLGKRIIRAYDDQIYSYPTSSIQEYTHIDGWSAIAPGGSYVTVSGRGHLRSGFANRIVAFKVTIYI